MRLNPNGQQRQDSEKNDKRQRRGVRCGVASSQRDFSEQSVFREFADEPFRLSGAGRVDWGVFNGDGGNMRLALVGTVVLCGIAVAQTTGFQPMNPFPLIDNPLAVRRNVQTGVPFTVAGPQGILVGQQDGTFEAWILPVKLLSHFSIRAEVEGYPVPIELKDHAREIEVFPDRTVITYSHIAFTVRQIMFAPNEIDDGAGAVAFFQMDSTRPVDLTFSFTPEMRPMWPQPSQGTPSAEWIKRDARGFYVLHTDFPNLAGAIAMPATQPGVMPPYQEKPQFHPLELRLHYDPKRDKDHYFPLADGGR